MRREFLALALLLSACGQDITPPVITSMAGPENGSQVDFDSFCFPLVITDNYSKLPELYARSNFDNQGWTDWSNNMAPCFDGVSDGVHIFAAQAKDQAGNLSPMEVRQFLVKTH
jgi:hypothetical protein